MNRTVHEREWKSVRDLPLLSPNLPRTIWKDMQLLSLLTVSQWLGLPCKSLQRLHWSLSLLRYHENTYKERTWEIWVIHFYFIFGLMYYKYLSNHLFVMYDSQRFVEFSAIPVEISKEDQDCDISIFREDNNRISFLVVWGRLRDDKGRTLTKRITTKSYCFVSYMWA